MVGIPENTPNIWHCTKKWSFPLRIFSVNAKWKTSFFVQCEEQNPEWEKNEKTYSMCILDKDHA